MDEAYLDITEAVSDPIQLYSNSIFFSFLKLVCFSRLNLGLIVIIVMIRHWKIKCPIHIF